MCCACIPHDNLCKLQNGADSSETATIIDPVPTPLDRNYKAYASICYNTKNIVDSASSCTAIYDIVTALRLLLSIHLSPNSRHTVQNYNGTLKIQ